MVGKARIKHRPHSLPAAMRPVAAVAIALVVAVFAAGSLAAQPVTDTHARVQLRQAIAVYRQLAEAGGWPPVPAGPTIEPGKRSVRVNPMRLRLQAAGEHRAAAAPLPDIYDTELQASVRQFQRRHGIPADGRIGRRTVRAMNVSVHVRLAQLINNLQRSQQTANSIARSLNRSPAGAKATSRYVLVNIPSLELIAVNNGVAELTSAVIVGRRDRQTPRLVTAIRAINFHPAWYVPDSIVRQDLSHKLVSDPGYFVRRNYHIVRSDDGVQLDPFDVQRNGLRLDAIRIWQAPGPYNPLGRIRIDMPNRFAVYLHDTPATLLFSWPERALSSGCVRVSRIVELANWLVADSGWRNTHTSDALRANKPLTVALRQPVPVHFVYLTAWVDKEGTVQFRDDLYDLDKLDGAARLSRLAAGQSVSAAGMPVSTVQIRRR